MSTQWIEQRIDDAFERLYDRLYGYAMDGYCTLDDVAAVLRDWDLSDGWVDYVEDNE